MIQRPVYGGVNIGHNSPCDTYNSIVYNTRPVPLIMMGHAGRGQHFYYFDKDLGKNMNMKKAEDAKDLLLDMENNEIWNYCPFLNSRGRCRVYEARPPICREFGSSPLRINYCSRKSSRYDIFKYYLKESLNIKEIFNFYKNLFKKAVFEK